ncbi:MAG: hypothetical protein J6U40_08745 [Kiritimatiellae bacterium]|nr:hypothetical protein [Kiritimatiellia bacterium]MBP5228452.1 hypothetical protein [Kiritimatiellia bacterium]
MKTGNYTGMVWFCAALALAFSVCAQTMRSLKQEPPNLLSNGDFEDEEDPLKGWTYVFDNNKHYLKNHQYVSVTADTDSSRPHVLKLDATDHDVCVNQGVQIYSPPVRFDPKKLYKVSLSARSTGPKCRIYAIGYRWKPGAKKSNHPEFSDLREAVRFQPIYFNNAKTGQFSFVPKQWKRAERLIPTHDRSELQQTHLENCEWLMLKILALDATGVDKCDEGILYVDDVKIQEIGNASEVAIRKGGANTKGFEGDKSWKQEREPSEAMKKLTPISGPHPSKGPNKKKK